MTEVILHGLVGKKFKTKYKFANIYKPTDVIEAIDANCNGFKNFFKLSAGRNMYYEMIVDGNEITAIDQALEKKQINRVEIVPCISGALPTFIAEIFINVLIGVVMAGIQYLLTPIPEDEPKSAIAKLGARSFLFANRENLAEQYTAVPLGYGALRIGSKIIQTVVDPISLSSNESKVAFNLAPGSSASSSDSGGDAGVGGAAGGAGGY